MSVTSHRHDEPDGIVVIITKMDANWTVRELNEAFAETNNMLDHMEGKIPIILDVSAASWPATNLINLATKKLTDPLHANAGITYVVGAPPLIKQIGSVALRLVPAHLAWPTVFSRTVEEAINIIRFSRKRVH